MSKIIKCLLILFISGVMEYSPVSLIAQFSNEPEEVKHEQVGNMIKIPAGVFWMGNNTREGFTNEMPYHPVYLDSFYVDKYEVMNMDYVEFLNAGGNDAHYHPLMSDDKCCGIFKYPNGRYAVTPGREDYPVTYVTWEDAVAYARWCGKRLLTEAEWEKAARGGLVGKKFIAGNYIAQDEANYTGRAFLDQWDYTAPVGGFEPNGYGLHDICGNVWEWVQDYYAPNFYSSDTMYNPVNDPKDNHSIKYRIIRGGSWADLSGKDSYLRVACRGPNYPIPENWANRIGFRCARSVPPSREQQQQAGIDYLIEKMKKNNPDIYGKLTADSLRNLILNKRKQLSVVTYKSNFKSVRKAIVLSLILPGIGEIYTGRLLPGLVFLGIETASWGTFLDNSSKANKIDVEYRNFAETHFDMNRYMNWLSDYRLVHGGVSPPSYTNIPPIISKNTDYYVLISKYEQFLAGWDDYDPFVLPYGESENRNHFREVREFRRNLKDDYKKVAYIAKLFILGNHLVSILDTVLGVRRNTIYRLRGWCWDVNYDYKNYSSYQYFNVRYKW